MHNIEPYFKWRENYVASEDSRSPFYGQVYDEFSFSKKIYNYFIHPQWDEFGSQTLYLKVLFADYAEGYAIIEMIGEWNDCISNDIMFLKRDFADRLQEEGLNKFIFITENVLNFHGSDDCYYEEWFHDIIEEDGWIALLNTLDHVVDEMKETQLHHYLHVGNHLNGINWRMMTPKSLWLTVEERRHKQIRAIG